MALVTLRVLDGADRGKTFGTLATPITIGREEGNTVQLNDERVSRYHLKIQEDHDQLVLTDLDSTNGTRVNGEDVQLRILRQGDLITVGRSVLLIGSREEIAQRLAALRGVDVQNLGTVELQKALAAEQAASLDVELSISQAGEPDRRASPLTMPELPQRLSPGQAAQLVELLNYVFARVRGVLEAARVDERAHEVRLDERPWQALIDLQSRLAESIRAVSEPPAEDE